jgi:hypothetical protein
MKNLFKKFISDPLSKSIGEGDEPPGKTLVRLNSQSFFKKRKASLFLSKIKI